MDDLTGPIVPPFRRDFDNARDPYSARFALGIQAPIFAASTVANLPSASVVGAGARAFVTNANATTFASIVAGGGANKVPVVSDGTNWIIG